MKNKIVFRLAILMLLVVLLVLAPGCTDLTPVLSSPDKIPPIVTSTIPVNNSAGVAVNSAITVIFNETMNPLTIISVNFTLKQGDTYIAGTVSYSKVNAVFIPAANLSVSTPYTATVTTGVKDQAGNAMAADFTWSFTTGETPDTTAPMVLSTLNFNGATNVPVNSKIGVVFSEPMDPLTITKSTFTLKRGSKSVTGAITLTNVSAVFVPESALAFNTLYTVTITAGAKDLAGNPMNSNYTWSWTTGNAPDIAPPKVTGTAHVNGQLNVPVNTKVGVTFSEPMDPLTVTNLTFTLKQGNNQIPGTIIYSNVSAVFVPLNDLEYNTIYTVTITTGVKDLAGNPMAAPYTLSWTTGANPDTTSPMIIGSIHLNGDTDVAVNTEVGVTFSEPMDPLTVTNLTFTLKQGDISVPGTITYSNVSAVFVPLNNLAYNTTYTVTITTGVKDLAGNSLAVPYSLSWTTGTTMHTTAPFIDATFPTNSANGISIYSTTYATFSEALDPLTINNVTFTLKTGTAPVSGTVYYSGNTATFMPTNPLAANTVYIATISTGVRDLSGNSLVADYTWSFTTGGQ